MSGAPWDDTPENRRRLGKLEAEVLDGTASAAALAEYRRLRDAHDAWVIASPAYRKFCEMTARDLGADVEEFVARAMEPISYPEGSES